MRGRLSSFQRGGAYGHNVNHYTSSHVWKYDTFGLETFMCVSKLGHNWLGKHPFLCSTQSIFHYNDVIMSAMASQITSLTSVLLNRLYRRRWKKTSKLRVTGLCEGNSPVTGEFPTQMASNAENVSIWWRHHISTSQCGFLHLYHLWVMTW